MSKLNSSSSTDLFNPEELEGRFEMRTWIRIEYPPECECENVPESDGPQA